MSTVTHVYAPSARGMIDLAIGVLIGLRGCDETDAFRELLHTANTHNVSPFQLGRALVAIASHVSTDAEATTPAHRIAEERWGTLVG